MKVTIVSPEKELYAGEVDSVSVPGVKGRFEMLNGHAPIISTLTEGEVRMRGEKPASIHISGGFIELSNNEITICVEV